VQGYVIDAGATIICPHGGQATAIPTATRVALGGKPPLLVNDAMVIAGCPFVIPPATPSPCLRIQWLMPSTRVSVQGSPVLVSSSVGMCFSAQGIPQGQAIVTGYQTRVQAQ